MTTGGSAAQCSLTECTPSIEFASRVNALAEPRAARDSQAVLPPVSRSHGH